MELQEAVAHVKGILSVKEEVYGLSDDDSNAISIVNHFCQSVLACKIMPEKRKFHTPTCLEQTNKKTTNHLSCICGLEGFNDACDLWQAWAAKMLDVKRIRKVIDYYHDSPYDSHFPEMTREEYRNHFASAIVAELKEGK